MLNAEWYRPSGVILKFVGGGAFDAPQEKLRMTSGVPKKREAKRLPYKAERLPKYC
jgi:hypothetical protein